MRRSVFDSNGIEIKHGDIIECPKEKGTAWHYHVAFLSDGTLEIRDLGANNLDTYCLYGDYFNIGPYWKHLDKLTDDDLEYYFDTTREESEKKTGKKN